MGLTTVNAVTEMSEKSQYKMNGSQTESVKSASFSYK